MTDSGPEDPALPQGFDTPLHRAVRRHDVDLVRRLVRGGMAWAINARDSMGQAPLHWAVMGGAVETVRALLELGADPNLVDSTGVPPLWTAEDDFGLDAIAMILRQHGGTKA